MPKQPYNRGMILVVLLALLLIVGWDTSWSDPLPVGNANAITSQQIGAAIDLAAGYILRSCDVSGRFVYLVNTKHTVHSGQQYNMLRHSGAIYGLVMYEQVKPNEKTLQVIYRSVKYLERVAVAPLEDDPSMAAVWSYTKVSDNPNLIIRAKLGGSALGLIALLSAEKVLPGTTPIEKLRQLGRFLLFMQKEDGSFYTEYVPSQGGRSSKQMSVYYTGETCLGLIMLYEKDPNIQWLQGAANGIAYLARSRKEAGKTALDYWALIATAELLKYYDHCQQPVSRNMLLQHAADICKLTVSSAQRNFKAYPGCFSGDRRTTPTAAGLEGLLAALTFLPDEYRSLRSDMVSVVREGVAFLMTGQLTQGEYAGGFLAKAPSPQQDSMETADSDTEIRIDYVQHALSALLGYQQFLDNK